MELLHAYVYHHLFQLQNKLLVLLAQAVIIPTISTLPTISVLERSG
jgi:uncharacterized membrane protein